jgi:hypothetical protein
MKCISKNKEKITLKINSMKKTKCWPPLKTCIKKYKNKNWKKSLSKVIISWIK